MERSGQGSGSPGSILTNCSAEAENLEQRLYNARETEQGDIDVCVDDWMALYSNDIKTALVTFVLFVLRTAGAQVPQEIDHSNLMSLPAIQVCYMLSNRSKWVKKDYLLKDAKYRITIQSFWLAVWKKAVEHGAAFDGGLFETLLQFFKTMCQSDCFRLRYTCTFFAMQLMPLMETTRLELGDAMREKSSFPKVSFSSLQPQTFNRASFKEGREILFKLLKIILQIFEITRRDQEYLIRHASYYALREVIMMNPITYDERIYYFCESMGDNTSTIRILSVKLVAKMIAVDDLKNIMVEVATKMKPRFQILRCQSKYDEVMPYLLQIIAFLYRHEPTEFTMREADILFDIIAAKNMREDDVEDATQLLVGKYLRRGKDYDGYNDQEKVILNLAKHLMDTDNDDDDSVSKKRKLELDKCLCAFLDLKDKDFVHNLWMKVTRKKLIEWKFRDHVLNVIVTNFKIGNLKLHVPMPGVMEILKFNAYFFNPVGKAMERLFLSAWYLAFPNCVVSTNPEDCQQLLNILQDIMKEITNGFQRMELSIYFFDWMCKNEFVPAYAVYDRLKEKVKEDYATLVQEFKGDKHHLFLFLKVPQKVELILGYTHDCDNTIFDTSCSLLEKLLQSRLQNWVALTKQTQNIICATLSASFALLVETPDPELVKQFNSRCWKYIELCFPFLKDDYVGDKMFEHLCLFLNKFHQDIEKHPDLQSLVIFDNDRFIMPVNEYMIMLIKRGVTWQYKPFEIYWDFVKQDMIAKSKTKLVKEQWKRLKKEQSKFLKKRKQ